MADCCPPGSVGSRSAAEAGAQGPLKGEEVLIDPDMVAYVSRPTGESKGAIVVFHDIFGYDSARTHYIVDEIASWGYIVIEPDFYGKKYAGVHSEKDVLSLWQPWKIFTGGAHLISRMRIPWSILEEKLKLVLSWLESNGAKDKKLGLLGFCWGGWAVVEASTSGKFSCLVGAHPSIDVNKLQSEGPRTEDLLRMSKCPALFLPAGNDPSSVKQNGSYFKILQEVNPGSKCVVYSNMSHGYLNRGDLRKPEIKAVYESAMNEIKDYYEQYLL